MQLLESKPLDLRHLSIVLDECNIEYALKSFHFRGMRAASTVQNSYLS